MIQQLKRILVVDVDRLDRRTFRSVLTKAGYDCDEAGTASSALA